MIALKQYLNKLRLYSFKRDVTMTLMFSTRKRIRIRYEVIDHAININVNPDLQSFTGLIQSEVQDNSIIPNDMRYVVIDSQNCTKLTTNVNYCRYL